MAGGGDPVVPGGMHVPPPPPPLNSLSLSLSLSVSLSRARDSGLRALEAVAQRAAGSDAPSRIIG
eukprot:8696981-Pyramimonas_sp.AAC.1